MWGENATADGNTAMEKFVGSGKSHFPAGQKYEDLFLPLEEEYDEENAEVLKKREEERQRVEEEERKRKEKEEALEVLEKEVLATHALKEKMLQDKEQKIREVREEYEKKLEEIEVKALKDEKFICDELERLSQEIIAWKQR